MSWTWPTTEQLHDAGIWINCPDCGEFLLEGEGLAGHWRDDCPACGWPTPDVNVEEVPEP